jgi:hypothetical protein
VAAGPRCAGISRAQRGEGVFSYAINGLSIANPTAHGAGEDATTESATVGSRQGRLGVLGRPELTRSATFPSGSRGEKVRAPVRPRSSGRGRCATVSWASPWPRSERPRGYGKQ